MIRKPEVQSDIPIEIQTVLVPRVPFAVPLPR